MLQRTPSGHIEAWRFESPRGEACKVLARYFYDARQLAALILETDPDELILLGGP